MTTRILQEHVRRRLRALTVTCAVAVCGLRTVTFAAEVPVHTYPLDTCIVSGDALDGAEASVTIELGLREIRFCSADCSKAFEADTEEFLRQLDAAIIETQLPGYPLDTCLKTGQPLGGMGEPYNHVYGNRLVRLCCAGCIKGFENDAVELLAILDKAFAEQRAADSVEE